MPAYPQPRARNDSRGRFRIQSVFTLKCLFIISTLFSLTACATTTSSTNTSELINKKSINTPKTAQSTPISTTIVVKADPAATPASAPAVTADSAPAPVLVSSIQAPLAAPEAALQEPVAAPIPPAQATASVQAPIMDSSAASLQGVLAEEGGVIDQSACTRGLGGDLTTAQAGGSFLSANGASASVDDEAPVVATVRPATPLVDLAPSAGANEVCTPPATLSLKAGLTQSLLMAAYEQTGRPYAVGGQSPATGFDATGYVRWVYGQKGVNLPKEAQKQAGAGRQVAKDDLRPGDLLIYRDPDSKGEAYHVGIYTGQGNFLHATAKTGVVNETAAFGPQYAPYFMGGRRYFDDPKAAPLSDAQKMAAASSAVKLALSELGPNDKLVRPIIKPKASAKSSGKAKSGGKPKKK